jgi:hypothetical protein
LTSTPKSSSAADFLTLVISKLSRLETLDLRGCKLIPPNALVSACEELRRESRTSTIRHLALSGCTLLRADIFPAMNGLFPELRYLELASTPHLFQRNSQAERTSLHHFLQTLPYLEKLDIEDTASGGTVNDSTLGVLARMSHLTDLKVGFADVITPEAMVRFIRDCPSLRVLEVNVSQSRE